MYNLLIDAAKEKGNKIGLNCDGEKITYNECKNKMLSIANALSEFGISAGDKVGLIMDSPLDQYKIFCRRAHMKQGTLYYDKECGRYNFDYTDKDGNKRGFIVKKFLSLS